MYKYKENYDGAIADYSTAIKLKPSNVEFYERRADAFMDDDDYNRAIADYSSLIKLKPDDGYYVDRAGAYSLKGDYDRAIADWSEVIRREPADESYRGRASVYLRKGDIERAIEDYNEAIKLSSVAVNYSARGDAYAKKGDYNRAIQDYTEAIRLDPKSSHNHLGRSALYTKKGNHDLAIADATAAIELKGGHGAYLARGEAYLSTRQYDKAIADFDRAIDGRPKHVRGFVNLGKSYEEKGERTKAMEYYNRALAIDTDVEEWKSDQAKARKWLATLQAAPPPPVAVKPAPAEVTVSVPKHAPPPPSRRVALVIGNTAYTAVPALLNPRKDARDIAAALRAAGFAEVVERYELGLAALRTALADFEDLAKAADWAVVYYAGHGIEMDGHNYLVPVDAQLRRDSDVEDEALPLERVLSRVSPARKLQLVILDACRDNPFARKMTASTGLKRSIGARGLARFESLPTNLMIAYSAGKGEAALDGAAGENSPYAGALVKYLAEPQLELGIFFRKVRADVLAATQGKQRPFEDSSLTDVSLFFRQAAK